jgi:hypothetical protein
MVKRKHRILTKKQKNRPWLKKLRKEGLGETADYCEYKFVDKEYKELPKTDTRVRVLKRMKLEQRLSLESKLEQKEDYWSSQSHCDIESSYALGALYAFRAKDYTCSLIYRYINSKDIADALSLK